MTESAIDLTTIANLKTYLGIPSADTNPDTALQGLVTGASRFFLSQTGRANINSATYTETRTGYGTNIMALRNYPITAVSSLSFAGVGPTPIPVSTDMVTPGYYIDSDGKFIGLIGMYFPKCPNSVSVSYTAGYSSGDPALNECEAAVLAICAMWWKRRGYPDLASMSDSAMGGQTFIPLDIPREAKTIINAYSSPVVPM